VIQLAAADNTVSSAKTVGRRWVRNHTRIAKGKTVLRIDGAKRKLPRADIADLTA
jgi:hypothetical protein